MDVSEFTKRCCECRRFLGAEAFYKCSAKKDGLAAKCKDCDRQYQRRYREKNREYFRESCRRERAEKPELNRARTKRWREKNQDRKAAMNKAWREENKEHERERYRRWAAANKDKQFNQSRKRRARKHDAEGSHTFEDVWSISEEQGHCCFYCQTPLFGVFHADHAVPISRGGSDWPSNIRVACATCNISKGTKTEEEFIEWQRRLQQI